jgi:hypothetical protein
VITSTCSIFPAIRTVILLFGSLAATSIGEL